MYLQEHGAEVDITDDPDRAAFRDALGIPSQAASCHTALIEGYTLEGHIPVGAIQQLLADRPDAAGLALPGMPNDSPGMGGNPATWESQPVMLVTDNGDLVPFDY